MDIRVIGRRESASGLFVLHWLCLALLGRINGVL